MPVRIFIIDDSAVVRKVLTEILSAVPDFEVIGSAQDPIFAQAKMQADWPDVITLDVEMPRMDGITFLKKLMEERPTPVVMCSTLTEAGSKESVKALSLGAIDVVAKPKSNLKAALPEASPELISAIRTAAKAKIKVGVKSTAPVKSVEKKAAPAPVKGKSSSPLSTKTSALVAIGASTGGTQALELVLKALPINVPPILVVQHMPETFTKAFASRLNDLCDIEVREAEDGDPLLPGRALIAPGGVHMSLVTGNFGPAVQVRNGPLVSRHRPSVDVLFRSVANSNGVNALGIIMTGMGDDGAKGLRDMHEQGATTIAQDESSCVVYGMPKEAVKLGAVDYVLPLNEIPGIIANYP